jgi:hypothetical protein
MHKNKFSSACITANYVLQYAQEQIMLFCMYKSELCISVCKTANYIPLYEQQKIMFLCSKKQILILSTHKSK